MLFPAQEYLNSSASLPSCLQKLVCLGLCCIYLLQIPGYPVSRVSAALSLWGRTAAVCVKQHSKTCG